MRKSKASEALCVAQQISAIRAALHKHGYQIRKRPKQAAWNVFTPLHPPKTTPLPRGSGRKLTSSPATGTEGKLTPPLARGAGGVMQEATAKTHKRKCYLLTYQPAPISTWVLHPQTNDPDYHSLETIIQRAITRITS